MQNGKFTVDSREVAEMVDKEHSHLLRDVKGYKEVIVKKDYKNYSSKKSKSHNIPKTESKIHIESDRQKCRLNRLLERQFHEHAFFILFKWQADSVSN